MRAGTRVQYETGFCARGCKRSRVLLNVELSESTPRPHHSGAKLLKMTRQFVHRHKVMARDRTTFIVLAIMFAVQHVDTIAGYDPAHQGTNGQFNVTYDFGINQCKLTTITSFSKCMRLEDKLNNKLELWTEAMSSMRVIGMLQEYHPESQGTRARVNITYKIESRIKTDANGYPAQVIGVSGVSDIQPKTAHVPTTSNDDFLSIDGVSVDDVEYTSTGDRISRMLVSASTRWFVVKDASGFHADAMSELSTNLGLDVNVFSCRVDSVGLQRGFWKFPTSSFASTCSNIGYESFPASVEWKFTEFDASKDLNIKTKMLKFRSWMPATTSDYFTNKQGRKDWWNANRLGKDVKQIEPTDALVLSLGITNYAEGMSSYVKTVTLTRSVKQIAHIGSSLVTGQGSRVPLKPMGYAWADPAIDGPGAPGGHMLADLLVKWPEINGDVRYLSSVELTWPSISSTPKEIETFLYDYAEESCISNVWLYRVTSSTDAKSNKVTYKVGSVLEEVNDPRKNCVCGDVALSEREKCYSEFARQLKPTRVIENGRSQEAAIVQSLGGQSAEGARECLHVVKSTADGTACGNGGAQQLRYSSSKADTACRMKQGLLVTTSTIAMQTAMGALKENSYEGANAYRSKCTGAHNDVLPSMFSAIKDSTTGLPVYPEAESSKCIAPTRLGSSDSVIIGSNVINNMRGSSFSVSVETELFDPTDGVKCERPQLKCHQTAESGKNYWMVKNMPEVMTMAGDFAAGDKVKWFHLVTSNKDADFDEFDKDRSFAAHPGHRSSTKPVAVVESNRVDAIDDIGNVHTINVEGSITVKYGKFQKRTIDSSGNSKLRHLYAHKGTPATDGEFARVECDAGDLQAWIGVQKSGEKSLGRRLLSSNGGDTGRRHSSSWQCAEYSVVTGRKIVIRIINGPTSAATQAAVHHHTTGGGNGGESIAKKGKGKERDDEGAWKVARWFLFVITFIIFIGVGNIYRSKWMLKVDLDEGAEKPQLAGTVSRIIFKIT